MAWQQEKTPQPSEKDRLYAHYNNQLLEREHSLTPTSISLGSPVSPLTNAAAFAGSGGRISALDSPQQQNDAVNTDAHSPVLPPYSGPASASQLALLTPTQQTTQTRSNKPRKYPGLPPLNYDLYLPPLFELSTDCTTLKSTAPHLSASASALAALVRAQATVPPKQQIHIVGDSHGLQDFALRLNLMHLLVPDRQQQRMDYLRCVAPGESALRGGAGGRPSLEPGDGPGLDLEGWARRFVEDASPVKSFALERTVVNLDTDWLDGKIRSLVASTGYRGAVTVTFPTTHARVLVQSPDRVNKFFTGLTKLLTGCSKYEVVQAVWPFASCRSDEPGAKRTCVVQSEEQWWREWSQPIRRAIVTRRKGWVTNEDKLVYLMEEKGNSLAKVDWGDGRQR